RIDDDTREPLRQFRLRDLPKPILLVEAVRREKLGSRPEVDLPHLVFATMRQQCFEQPQRDSMPRTPVLGAHEHFAQRDLMIADVEQRDGSYDLSFVQRDPEVAAAALIKGLNVQKVRLLVERDGNREFGLLDGENDCNDAGGVRGSEWENLDHRVFG